MRTWQFTIPHSSTILRTEFLDKIGREFDGYTVLPGLGAWSVPGDLLRIDQEPILVVQVTTNEGGILKERVCAYLRNIGEQAAYFGLVGEHDIITLDKEG